MADDDQTPRPTKRFQTQTERDSLGLAARKERERRVPQPIYPAEETTGKYTGEELERRRAARPTPDRVSHLERRVDGLYDEFGTFRADVADELGNLRADVGKGMGDMAGEIKGLAGEMKGLATVVTESSKRDHVTFKAQVEVDTAKELDKIDAAKIIRTDELDAKKARRKRLTTIIGAVVGLLTSGGVLTVVLQKLGIL